MHLQNVIVSMIERNVMFQSIIYTDRQPTPENLVNLTGDSSFFFTQSLSKVCSFLTNFDECLCWNNRIITAYILLFIYFKDLTISVTVDQTITEVELCKDPRDKSTINVSKFGDEQEWTLHDVIVTKNSRSSDPWQPGSMFAHPVFTVSCQATRKPSFFLWNIILVMVNFN